MLFFLPYHKLEEIKDGSLCTKPRVVSPINRLGATDERGSAEYDRFDHRPKVLMPRYSNEADDKLYVMENAQ